MKLDSAELAAADHFINHLCEQIDHYTTTGDPLRDRYVGFCAVTIATHAETYIKTCILDFCGAQNQFLLSILEHELKRFNGRISYDDLKRLLERFEKHRDTKFAGLLRRYNRRYVLSSPGATDIFVAYKSVLSIRHSFVHNLEASFSHVTSQDLRMYSNAAKRVSSAFARCLS